MSSKKFSEFWSKHVDHVVLVDLEARWDTYNNPEELVSESPCSYLWERMYVWYDGKCNPCDIDYKSFLQVGTLETNTIQEIWNGNRYSKLRDAHLSGKRKSCLPCNRCSFGG